MSEHGNAGFDDWLDAAADGEAYYLTCPADHTALPPRRVCPECGATDLDRRELPETGAVQTATVTHVPTPSFEEDAPYATAIADFGPVRVTGLVVGTDPESVTQGQSVTVDVVESATTGDRVIALRPA